MKLQLDTHTFLWYADGSPRLSVAATALLIDPLNELFLSMASIWEIAIKVGMKRLLISTAYEPFVTKAVTSYGITVLPITFDDCVYYEALPFPDQNHRDPFDRMIITHALRNGLTIVGTDPEFDAYGVSRLW